MYTYPGRRNAFQRVTKQRSPVQVRTATFLSVTFLSRHGLSSPACSSAVCRGKRTAGIYGLASTSLWGRWTGSARLELNSIYPESRCLTNGHIRHAINAGQLLVSVFYKNV